MTTTLADGTFVAIELSKLKESPTNPRKRFDEAKLQELAASITQKGVVQPVVVRPVGDNFEIVAGARRFRASQLAGKSEIPAIVRHLSDDDAIEIQVIENLQREDIDPIEEAEGFAALLATGRWTTKDIADRIGSSERFVAKRVALTKLLPEVREWLVESGCAIGVLQVAANLQPDDQKRLKKAYHHHVELKVRDISWWINSQVLRRMSSLPWIVAGLDPMPKTPCSSCPKNTANTPHMFEELNNDPGDATCTDLKCLEKKIDVWQTQQIAHFRESFPDAPLLSHSFGATPFPGSLPTGKWLASSAKKKGAKPGILVGNGGSVVLQYWVPYGTPGSKDGDEDAAEKRAQQREKGRQHRAATLARFRIYTAVLERLEATTDNEIALFVTGTKVTFDLLRPVIVRLATLTSQTIGDHQDKWKHPGRSTLFKARILKAEHRLHDDKKMMDCAYEATVKDMLISAFESATSVEIHVGDYGTHEPETLYSWAEKLGIDIKQIEKDADWETLSKKQQAERRAADRSGVSQTAKKTKDGTRNAH